MSVTLSLTVIFVLWGGWLLVRRHVYLIYGLPILLAGLFLGGTSWGGTLIEITANVIGALAQAVTKIVT
ncbi:hypothetical protein LX15_005981 [Streptoalloteichus tenebrarius]|uniref:Uncharacterized protein n=1 Tax=Streptoalloteichus tenebrarius (strain ATCC 17920 / DSM 40477 / JCM 4838 / CBS 697.72 / NBRC 16177 / NCIMB 11028 / NRRL B-12390 / A12253. 1 / ISP 5477) TaxID=1933 RepID=A0ABT1I3A4_STRSD|nr:hypothetical protein [Streptoalloteichus tenebrarius]MCP2262247.1 hypothetical protein [Streptoalloteichus tenebrarius]BFF00773.1 hypothetical protein GCM10020241_24480 [Streptoalloteichus tenebrarius]